MQQPALPVERLSVLAGAAALLFGLGLGAEAKVPPFEMEVEVDDTRATVTVTFEEEGFDPPHLAGLVAIYSASDLDDEGRPSDQSVRVDFPFARTDFGTYQGTVLLQEAGYWAAVAFPDVTNVATSALSPYPPPVHFETATSSTSPWVIGGAAAAVVVLSIVGFRRRPPWRPLLAATLVLGLVGGAGISDESEGPFECPVTVPPQPGYSPPGSHPANYPHVGSVWYGTEVLWTVLPVDGEYGPRKSVWWSARFPGGHLEQRPELHVTWTRLDAGEPVVIDNEGSATNAHTTEEGWFMIAGIDPDAAEAGRFESGCWQVTARYKGATLSYVYERPDPAAG